MIEAKAPGLLYSAPRIQGEHVVALTVLAANGLLFAVFNPTLRTPMATAGVLACVVVGLMLLGKGAALRASLLVPALTAVFGTALFVVPPVICIASSLYLEYVARAVPQLSREACIVLLACMAMFPLAGVVVWSIALRSALQVHDTWMYARQFIGDESVSQGFAGGASGGVAPRRLAGLVATMPICGLTWSCMIAASFIWIRHQLGAPPARSVEFLRTIVAGAFGGSVSPDAIMMTWGALLLPGWIVTAALLADYILQHAASALCCLRTRRLPDAIIIASAVRKLADTAGIGTPLVALGSSMPRVTSNPILCMRHVLIVPRAMPQLLYQDGQLDAVLAHELGHMFHKDTYVFEALRLVGRMIGLGDTAAVYFMHTARIEDRADDCVRDVFGLDYNHLVQGVDCVMQAEGSSAPPGLPIATTHDETRPARSPSQLGFAGSVLLWWKMLTGRTPIGYWHAHRRDRLARLRRTGKEEHP